MSDTEHQPAVTREPSGWRDAGRRVPTALLVSGLVSGCLLLTAGAVYLAGVVAVRLAPLSIAMAAAVLLTALLQPVVGGLRRFRIPRGLAAGLAVLLLVAAFVAPAVLLWNLTADQFGDLTGRLGEGIGRMRRVVVDVLPITEEQLDRVLAGVEERVQRMGADLLAGALTLVEVLAAVILALFVLFFLLKDGPSMWAWLLEQAPRSARGAMAEAGQAGWETITRYVRGTLIVAAIDALGIGIALAIIGVPLALPLALLVFVGGFIPYVGATVSGIVAVLVALAANGPVDALLTLVAVIAVQQIEGNLLEPLIMSRQVRLHPVVVVVAVFAGSLIAGIAGAVVAVPITAVAYRVARVLRDRRAAGRLATVSGPP